MATHASPRARRDAADPNGPRRPATPNSTSDALLRPHRPGRSTTVLAALVCTLLGLAVPRAAAAPHTGQHYVALVRSPDDDLVVKRFQVSSPGQVTDVLRTLHRTGTVVSLELDSPVHALGTGDPYRGSQWALNHTSFERSWALTNGRGAVVAVVDTGVQADHEDLTGTVMPGWDAITDQPGGTSDPHGHGTHVAGIIAAAARNGKGIAGSAPGVRILPVRVLGADGSGSRSDILEGIIWAADQGADVINLSLGGTGGADGYARAIQYALDKGAVVVAAAGNNALDGNEPQYPAADPGAIAVAATTPSDDRAPFSNHGGYIDLAAPGTSIQSTVPTGYAAWSGTSMAAPHVAAAAALLAARDPGLSPARSRDLLERSARDLGESGRDDEFGAGLVDPDTALSLTAPVPGPVPIPVPIAAPPPPRGYWVVGADGRVAPFGAAPALGDAAGLPLNAPIVAAATTSSGRGYWLAGGDGSVLAFGDAADLGSARAFGLKAPIVGMAATPSGRGYWLLGGDGGVFSFGDAGFFGSTGAVVLNQPVVDLAPTTTGSGYWLVAADGGVFAFGDATFHGSTGALHLSRPVVSLTPSPTGGYWMVGSDGGIFAFDTPFHGSLPGLNRTALPAGQRIRATDGGGYYVLGADGQIFPFGQVPDLGSSPGLPAVDLVLFR